MLVYMNKLGSPDKVLGVLIAKISIELNEYAVIV